MPEGVELSDKELALATAVATVYDPAVEAAAREAEETTENAEDEAEGSEAEKTGEASE